MAASRPRGGRIESIGEILDWLLPQLLRLAESGTGKGAGHRPPFAAAPEPFGASCLTAAEV